MEEKINEESKVYEWVNIDLSEKIKMETDLEYYKKAIELIKDAETIEDVKQVIAELEEEL